MSHARLCTPRCQLKQVAFDCRCRVSTLQRGCATTSGTTTRCAFVPAAPCLTVSALLCRNIVPCLWKRNLILHKAGGGNPFNDSISRSDA